MDFTPSHFSPIRDKSPYDLSYLQGHSIDSRGGTKSNGNFNTEKSILDMQSINKYYSEGQIVCLFVGVFLLLLFVFVRKPSNSPFISQLLSIW